MIKFPEIQDLLDKALEPEIGFEGPYPVPYSASFTNGVQAGWRAAIARVLQMIVEAGEPEIIGTAEAAEICGVGVHAIIKAIKRGLLAAVKIGGEGQAGKWAMLKSEALRYKRERRPVGRPRAVADDCQAPCPGCLTIVGHEGECLLDDALFGRPQRKPPAPMGGLK